MHVVVNCLGFSAYMVKFEVCAKILCSEKELLNLNDSKLTQNFYGNKTGFVGPGHICLNNSCPLLPLPQLHM